MPVCTRCVTVPMSCYCLCFLWEPLEHRKTQCSVRCWGAQSFLCYLRKEISLLEEFSTSTIQYCSLRSSFTDAPEPLICSGYCLLSPFSLVLFFNRRKVEKLLVKTVLTLFRINMRQFHFVQTMIFAIQEINNSSSLLPNISIGYKVFDNCASTLYSTRVVMGLMNGQERTLGQTCSGQSSVHAIIGPSDSSSTIAMLRIAGLFQIPVVNMCHIFINFFTDFTMFLFTT